MTTPYASEAFLHQLLGKALAAGASDVHLKVGQPPGARVRGDMVYFRVEKIRPEDTEAVARVLLGAHATGRDRLDERAASCVTAYEADGLGRFRVSDLPAARRARAGDAQHRRCKIPTLAELGGPPRRRDLAERSAAWSDRRPAAAAGETSAAAMIGHLNAATPST